MWRKRKKKKSQLSMKIIINTLDREAKVFLGIEYIAEI
jgi:hypothetical protein